MDYGSFIVHVFSEEAAVVHQHEERDVGDRDKEEAEHRDRDHEPHLHLTEHKRSEHAQGGDAGADLEGRSARASAAHLTQGESADEHHGDNATGRHTQKAQAEHNVAKLPAQQWLE